MTLNELSDKNRNKKYEQHYSEVLQTFWPPQRDQVPSKQSKSITTVYLHACRVWINHGIAMFFCKFFIIIILIPNISSGYVAWE